VRRRPASPFVIISLYVSAATYEEGREELGEGEGKGIKRVFHWPFAHVNSPHGVRKEGVKGLGGKKKRGGEREEVTSLADDVAATKRAIASQGRGKRGRKSTKRRGGSGGGRTVSPPSSARQRRKER